MGVGSERHDLHSYETHDSQWLGFRQPVMKAARQREGETIDDTRKVNPGEVWEENEFWLELTWRIDPDGGLAFDNTRSRKRIRGRDSVSTSITNGSSKTLSPVCPNAPRRKM